MEGKDRKSRGKRRRRLRAAEEEEEEGCEEEGEDGNDEVEVEKKEGLMKRPAEKSVTGDAMNSNNKKKNRNKEQSKR